MEQKTKILTPQQKEFLDIVSEDKYLCKKFYLTGGTPLSAFYLYHRISEDIDLFCEEEINLLPIRAFLGKVQRKLKLKKIDHREWKQFFIDYAISLKKQIFK
jgi:predicted nucleotidyltransferase component of viral defense system